MKTLRNSVFAGALAALVPAIASAQAVLQINSSLPEGSFAHVFLLEYEERLEAAAPGEIDVQIFMSNTLGKEEDVLQGLGLGTHHASLSASAVSQINTRTAIFDLPYLFEDRAAVQAFAASPAGEMLAEGFEGSGMVLAAMWDNGFRQITNNVRPIVTPADLDGLKIRTPTSRQRVEMFNTLGANATPLSFGEVYSALDQGTIDGQENPANVVDTAKLFEVQGYMSLSNHVYLPTFLVFGEPYLASLDPELRETVFDVAQELSAWTFEWGETTDTETIAALSDKIAVNEIDFAAFQAASAPLYESPTFVDVIGADMIAATKTALGIE
ncbi:TRAP transporter substrate-binding protein [Ponticoccus sp. SC2-23]|uniref:TRAP transporter substrate-binding protein n=1 Tax=Alexandriicola marinus TaxID=2081710 RepID=UPI000FDB2B0E|nr:TRAP transporter substrate-binding protein [Alexandriicola marinus]MBM1221302.1 TRAP transporter substrate-binding protein [Ponticoccus sp. SC6-9]MBM1225872.1 TRAP transporter substrate-binding protein [Ponticoccus sp. SC6-15]MBM1228024.1 TRAP transporter substrate-binding protein [Ponticoccus sp. SC6-38]MBM1234338.1 TRAP transporter substrate-binding protein [Ponticoccus sp. SC6-45]MBM1238526.1 TRAP transporter substrate-binding protein [Ponticoccus sp. SC6-49]MBM1243795.1 TRAP transporte